DIPAAKLANEAPVYYRESREPGYLREVRALTLTALPDVTDPLGTLKALLSWPTIASKNWVYRQYDHMVRDNTFVAPGSDAAVIRIKEDSLPSGAALPAAHPASDASTPLDGRRDACPTKLIALTVDCNATYVYLDPYE